MPGGHFRHAFLLPSSAHVPGTHGAHVDAIPSAVAGSGWPRPGRPAPTTNTPLSPAPHRSLTTSLGSSRLTNGSTVAAAVAYLRDG